MAEYGVSGMNWPCPLWGRWINDHLTLFHLNSFLLIPNVFKGNLEAKRCTIGEHPFSTPTFNAGTALGPWGAQFALSSILVLPSIPSRKLLSRMLPISLLFLMISPQSPKFSPSLACFTTLCKCLIFCEFFFLQYFST